MVRVKRGNVARKRRKKILQLAKGYRGAHSRLFRVANQQVMKALRYSYVGRKQKKRIFRKIWIKRINAASRMNGISYSQLIHKFKKSNIDLNRKMLSQIGDSDWVDAQHYKEGETWLLNTYMNHGVDATKCMMNRLHLVIMIDFADPKFMSVLENNL